MWGLRVVIFLLLGSKSAVCSREQFVGGSGRRQAMTPAALLSVLKRMGTGHAGSCSSWRASERQRKEQEEQDLGSFTELTCSPADLGSRTEQRVRASKFSWERERERLRGLQPAAWGDLQFTLKSWVSASDVLG